MASSPGALNSVPDKVDMRDVLCPVENLGQIPASAASAVATALEYHCIRVGEQPVNLSTMFIHYNARLSTGQEGANVGTTIEAAIKAVATYGACSEASWPFDSARFAEKPPPQAYEEAKKRTAVSGGNPSDVVEALSLRYPVAAVVKLPIRLLREIGRDGIMASPSADEMQKPGDWINHGMVVVGYDKTAGTFLVRNCWGTKWGDEGHCRIAFDLMKVIAPHGTGRLWFIATKAATQAIPDTAAASFQGIQQPAAVATQGEKLSDIAARLRQEIRGDLQRDLADASKRIRDMVGGAAAGGAAAPGAGTRAQCSACSGRGVCWKCGGSGCGACGNGKCPSCWGNGYV